MSGNPGIGAIFFSTYGAVWIAVAIATGSVRGGVVLGCALAVAYVALLATAIRAARGYVEAPRAEAAERRAGRAFGIVNAVQGVAIFIAIQICAREGRVDLTPAAIELIVGLHFVPVARIFAIRAYDVTAVALVVFALGSAVLGGTPGFALACLSAAATLWLTAAYRLLSARTAAA